MEVVDVEASARLGQYEGCFETFADMHHQGGSWLGWLVRRRCWWRAQVVVAGAGEGHGRSYDKEDQVQIKRKISISEQKEIKEKYNFTNFSNKLWPNFF